MGLVSSDMCREIRRFHGGGEREHCRNRNDECTVRYIGAVAPTVWNLSEKVVSLLLFGGNEYPVEKLSKKQRKPKW